MIVFFRTSFINFLVLISCSAFAQSSYSISGKVIDTEKEPVSYAQIAVYKPDADTPIKGTISTDNGNFKLNVQSGIYDLSISFIGYENKTIEEIQVNGSPVDLGVVEIAPSPKQLKEVVIEQKKIRQPISTDLEGINVNPEQTISNIGGSVLDVLRNTPSVNVSGW